MKKDDVHFLADTRIIDNVNKFIAVKSAKLVRQQSQFAFSTEWQIMPSASVLGDGEVGGR